MKLIWPVQNLWKVWRLVTLPLLEKLSEKPTWLKAKIYVLWRTIKTRWLWDVKLKDANIRPWYCIIQFRNLWQVVNSQIFDLQFVEFKAFLCCDQILHFIFYYYVFLYYLFGGGGPSGGECVSSKNYSKNWTFYIIMISSKNYICEFGTLCFSKLILLTCNRRFELCQWPRKIQEKL